MYFEVHKCLILDFVILKTLSTKDIYNPRFEPYSGTQDWFRNKG